MLRRTLAYLVLAVGLLTGSVTQADSSITGSGGAIRYDADYPAINYGKTATRNSIARLQSRLEKGEVRLEFKPPRGYLDSVLSALGIDRSSPLHALRGDSGGWRPEPDVLPPLRQ